MQLLTATLHNLPNTLMFFNKRVSSGLPGWFFFFFPGMISLIRVDLIKQGAVV